MNPMTHYPLDLDTIAQELLHAQKHGYHVLPYTSRTAAFDSAAGYAVAHLVHQTRMTMGYRSLGYKIGFTNRALWPAFEVSEPIWAPVYDQTVMYISGAFGICRIGCLQSPRIEPEIVLHFCAAPPVTHDPLQLLACIDWIAHGYEIVESPFPDWTFKAADCIAASACHHCLLIGEPQPLTHFTDDIVDRLAQFKIKLFCESILQDTGYGANVLGNPLTSMSGLLTTLSNQAGAPTIQAGDLVTTGTLTGAFPIHVGETWHTVLHDIPIPGLCVSFVD